MTAAFNIAQYDRNNIIGRRRSSQQKDLQQSSKGKEGIAWRPSPGIGKAKEGNVPSAGVRYLPACCCCCCSLLRVPSTRFDCSALRAVLCVKTDFPTFFFVFPLLAPDLSSSVSTPASQPSSRPLAAIRPTCSTFGALEHLLPEFLHHQ